MTTLDVRGEMCPYPAMKARAALKKLPRGECLSVLTDHAPALSTVPWEGAGLGFDSEITIIGPGEWRIDLTRTAEPIDRQQALASIARRAAELTGEGAN